VLAPEDGEIQHALLIARVVLQNDGIREQGLEGLDELCLIPVLSQNVIPSSRGFLSLL